MLTKLQAEYHGIITGKSNNYNIYTEVMQKRNAPHEIFKGCIYEWYKKETV